MSLAIALSTAHGIVMAADRYITATVNGQSFCKTTNAQKVFLCKNGYGFCYTGNANFRGCPSSYWMEKFIDRFGSLNLNVPNFVRKLCIAFYSLDKSQNIILIGAGYENDVPVIYSCNSSKRLLSEHPLGSAVYSGETDIAKAVIDTKPCNRGDYTLPDAIDFVRHVIMSTSNIQRFGNVAVTVGPNCDILLISKDKSCWYRDVENRLSITR